MGRWEGCWIEDIERWWVREVVERVLPECRRGGRGD